MRANGIQHIAYQPRFVRFNGFAERWVDLDFCQSSTQKFHEFRTSANVKHGKADTIDLFDQQRFEV
jgi:hypothetical protein